MTIAEAMVRWAWALAHEPPPPEVRAAAARQITDSLGVAVAGVRTGEAAVITPVADGFGAPAQATRFDRSDRVPTPIAAMVNGVALHALDFDDTHSGSLIHVSAAVLPAALAVAEEVGATGENLLDAVVVGNEVVTRLGAVVPHGFHSRGFHPTSVCGVFGATLAAAWLMELSEEQAVNALGIAGSSAAGSLEFLSGGATTKQLHPGMGAHAAVMAARMAAAGATGPATIFEGPNGLFRSYLDTDVVVADVVGTLGAEWETANVSVKRYPCCHLSHGTMDAAGELHELVADVGVDAVASVEAVVHPDAVDIVCEPLAQKHDPHTPYEAKFSMPWSVAAVLLDGAVTVDTFAQDRIRRSDVLELARRITYVVDPSPQVAAAAQPGELGIELAGGAQQAARTPGGGDVPLTDDEMAARFVSNAGADVADPGADGATGAAADLAASLLQLASADSTQLAQLIRGVAALAQGVSP